MNKICIIGVYFGKLPKYFPLWVKSCEFNRTIDFYVFTDDKNSEPMPSNVFLYEYSLRQMQIDATKTLGFDANLNRVRKCCDYKVIYGNIFHKHIEKYDYWGHCDFDLIFGDLQHFFNKYDLYKYDKFLALGHLSLYRNTEENRNRFKDPGSADNYRKIYSNDENFIFDELGGITQIYIANNYPIFTGNVFADIASVYTRYRLIEDYNLDTKPRNYIHQIFCWDNGKVYRDYIVRGVLHREEFMYIHFKNRDDFSVDFDVGGTEKFYITRFGFFAFNEQTSIDIINEKNPFVLFEESREVIVKKSRNILLRLYSAVKK